MESSISFLNESNTKIINSIRRNEGIFGQIENFLIEKKEREATLYRSNYAIRAHSHSSETDICTEPHERLDFLEDRQNLYDEWTVDLHKISLDTRPLDDFFSKQKYEGIVLSVNDETFIARLRNLTEKLPDEEAEFSIEDLSPDDLPLLSEGAMFYWNIGYRDMVGGQRIACHMINFRRLPRWTDQDLAAAEKQSRSLYEWLSSE